MKTKRWNQLGWGLLAVYIILRLHSYYINFLEFDGRLADLAQCNAVIDGVLLLGTLLPYRKRIITVPFLIILNGLFYSVTDLIFWEIITLYDIQMIIVGLTVAGLIVYCWKKGNAQLSLEDGYLKAE